MAGIESYDGSMGAYFPDSYGIFLHFVGDGICQTRLCFVVFGPQQPINGPKNVWIACINFLVAVKNRKVFPALIYSVVS